MNRLVNAIAGRLSLRSPQRQSLEVLDRITEIVPPAKAVDVNAALAIIQSEYPSVTDFERDFPSLCFALATGVGKTRLMGAFISYLYLAHGIKNFFVLAPNLTIYEKLKTDFTPNTPKYVFKGISEFATDAPALITGDNYESMASTLFDAVLRCKINIFNISKINSEVRGGKSPRIKRLSEYIGESYFQYLADLPDLVLLMDESHRYRASAGVRAINELRPVLGLELTATPFLEGPRGAVPFKNVIVDYPLGRAMADGFVKEPAVVTRKNFNPAGMSTEEIDRLKLEDGVRLHESVKVELETYARENDCAIVKPFVLVNRLDHSFLVFSISYSGEHNISFQHPSLRDLLLLETRSDADARIRYFSIATPFALTSIIGGIAGAEEAEGEPQHAVVPINEEEFNVFLGRLRDVSQEVLKLRDWELLLAAAERLIPTKPGSAAERGLREIWRKIGMPDPVELVDPVDLDLNAFASQSKGRIIRAILEGFALRRTFENSQRYSESNWFRLLTKFYRLTAYLFPPVYPTFTGEVCLNLSESLDSVRLANEINACEPIVLKQTVGNTRIEEWREKLADDASKLASTGSQFENSDDPDEFDQWESDVDELVDAARGLLKWTGTPDIQPVTEVVTVRESAERPRAPEPEDGYLEQREVSGPYWTIERMFEDL